MGKRGWEGAGLGGGVEGGGTFITDKDKQTDFSCFLWNNKGKWRSNILPEVTGEKFILIVLRVWLAINAGCHIRSFPI